MQKAAISNPRQPGPIAKKAAATNTIASVSTRANGNHSITGTESKDGAAKRQAAKRDRQLNEGQLNEGQLNEGQLNGTGRTGPFSQLDLSV
jgi:hypothetical protein